MEFLKPVLLILSYSFLGFTVKYIDDANDEGLFDRNVAHILAIVSGLLGGYLAAVDPATANYFTAMLLGLVFARKVDNVDFVMITALFLAVPIIFLCTGRKVKLDVVVVLVFLASTFVDEWANDWADKRSSSVLLKKIFYERPFSDVAVIGMTVIGWFPVPNLIGYFGFAALYRLVDIRSKKLQALRRGSG